MTDLKSIKSIVAEPQERISRAEELLKKAEMLISNAMSELKKAGVDESEVVLRRNPDGSYFCSLESPNNQRSRNKKEGVIS